MNFQEYLNQKDPKKMPRVELTENDCFQVIPEGKNKIIVLKMYGMYYSYIVPEQQINDKFQRLFTMDKCGNPKSRSCFLLKE